MAAPPTPTPPAILIAATHSGAGKTTATLVLLRALSRRGLDVQPFKIGPDFIDPAYHAQAGGRPSINLDAWMMGEDGVRHSFRRWSEGADVSVIEAMGALYDGADGSERGSAAAVAKLLGIPVVVVLDVWGMTRTTAAILEGLRAFDPELDIAGCVLNRVGSDAHARMIVDALPEHLRSLVVGTVPQRPELEIPERHLGLVTVDENATASDARAGAQLRAGQSLDVDRILGIAGVDGSRRPRPAVTAATPVLARLAIARDAAFSFYYEENLLALAARPGSNWCRSEPTTDPRLPTASTPSTSAAATPRASPPSSRPTPRSRRSCAIGPRPGCRSTRSAAASSTSAARSPASTACGTR